MTKPCVYVETTIPSFYHEERTDPGIVARREWTRRWWHFAPERYDLVTSPAVLDELAGGMQERSEKRLDLVRDLPLLPVESAIAEIAQGYIRHKLMPADPVGDALHLALASFHKFGHIRRVNTMLGLFVPALVTPLELLGDSDDTESG